MSDTNSISKKIQTVSRWQTVKRLTRMLDNPLPVISAYLEEYGDTYKMYMGGVQPAILTVEPAVIQHVLQKNHRNYAKSRIQTDVLGPYVGLGLLTSNGDYWLRQRRLIQPGFHRQKLAGLVEIMQQVIEKSCAHLDAKAEKGEEVDMSHESMEVAFKIVAKSLFGAQLQEETMNELAKGISDIQEFVVKLVRMPFMKPWYRLSGKTNKYRTLAARQSQIIMNLISERRASGATANDLLDMLLAARYEDTNEGMTDQQLQDESLILFVAGHETTANALTWMFYLLSQHPEVVTQLRNEFDAVLGHQKPTFENLRLLEYSTQVINETMRLYPPAWITDRVALADDTIAGYEIKKGDIIMPFIYGAHYSKNNWENPTQFNPNRFSKENKKKHQAFSFLPFGGGPRLCIGNSFAMMEMQLVLVHLLQKYDFTLAAHQQIEVQPLVTLRSKYGMKMKLTKR